MTVYGARLATTNGRASTDKTSEAPAERQVELLASILLQQGQCDAQTIDPRAAAMNVLTLMRPMRGRRWIGYPLGLVLIAIAFGVRLALGNVALKFPFVIFLPPIIVTTFVGGGGAGRRSSACGRARRRYDP